MPSSFESINSKLELEEEQIILFSDTISGIKKTIEGLAQLAGLEGLDSVAEKLQEAVEECDNLLGVPLNVHPPGDE